jgi:site-specific recombinase XerD
MFFKYRAAGFFSVPSLAISIKFPLDKNYDDCIGTTVLIDGKFSTYSYCDWIIRFVKFHGNQKHPKDMGKTEIEAFLSHLDTHRKVAVSTQRQALNALVFLYKHVLDKPIGDNIAPVKAKKRRRPPVVMAKTEVRQILNQMEGTHLQPHFARKTFLSILPTAVSGISSIISINLGTS